MVLYIHGRKVPHPPNFQSHHIRIPNTKQFDFLQSLPCFESSPSNLFSSFKEDVESMLLSCLRTRTHLNQFVFYNSKISTSNISIPAQHSILLLDLCNDIIINNSNTMKHIRYIDSFQKKLHQFPQPATFPSRSDRASTFRIPSQLENQEFMVPIYLEGTKLDKAKLDAMSLKNYFRGF